MTGGFYYAPPDAIENGEIRLPDEESRHAARVMRLGVGAEIQVVDGAGGWFRAEITSVGRKSVTARIIERRDNVGEPDYELVVGLGVIRNAGRFETFLEKGVELGLTRIVPFESDRTQKSSINRGRAERVLVAGMKQSMRSRIPDFDPVRTFEDVIADASLEGLRLIAHEAVNPTDSLAAMQNEIMEAARCVILIGSEGGFTELEIQLAADHGWRPISLGKSRLRSETAAIAAASVIQMIKSTNDGSDRTQD